MKKTRQEIALELMKLKKKELVVMCKEYGLQVSKSDMKGYLCAILSEEIRVREEKEEIQAKFKARKTRNELKNYLETATTHGLVRFAREVLGLKVSPMGNPKDRIIREILGRF